MARSIMYQGSFTLAKFDNLTHSAINLYYNHVTLVSVEYTLSEVSYEVHPNNSPVTILTLEAGEKRVLEGQSKAVDSVPQPHSKWCLDDPSFPPLSIPKEMS